MRIGFDDCPRHAPQRMSEAVLGVNPLCQGDVACLAPVPGAYPILRAARASDLEERTRRPRRWMKAMPASRVVSILGGLAATGGPPTRRILPRRRSAHAGNCRDPRRRREPWARDGGQRRS